ncbi:MAG: hypothetical protein HY400_00195 [Elusimicrobia bacterium]|nr:hypothetical protein [Elusimicrobiota bacterium]
MRRSAWIALGIALLWIFYRYRTNTNPTILEETELEDETQPPSPQPPRKDVAELLKKESQFKGAPSPTPQLDRLPPSKRKRLDPVWMQEKDLERTVPSPIP